MELKVKKNNKKGQQFSADIIIVVIIILFGGLFLILHQINKTEKTNTAQIEQEATVYSKLVVNELKKKNIIDNNNNINAQALLSINEEEMKQELGIKGDFAIVLEKEGKLVKIDAQDNVNCIGSSKIIVNGEPCK